MIAIVEPKKRTDQSAAEKKQIKLIKELLRIMRKEWGKMVPCESFHPQCSWCAHYVFRGHLESYLSDLEY